MQEYIFTCPYCFEEISMLIDTSIRQQEYVEDCEVCCNPIAINVIAEEGEITGFSAENLGQ